MRPAIVALVALGALLGLGPAGLAKGGAPTAAVIEGPGLAGPVRIESHEPTDRLPGIGALLQWTGGMVMYGDQVRLVPDQPTGDRGPRYTVTYYRDKQPMLTQHLYPFTANGPYTFTPAQPSISRIQPIPGGWWRAPQELAIALTVLGASPSATALPLRQAEPAQQPGPDPAGAPVPGPVAVGWWLAAIALVSSMVLLRRGTVGVRR